MKNINYSILLNIFILGILTVMLLTIFYATFLPNSKFLFFDESYLELLALEDTGGNGKLNLLTYPLTLYLICAFTCLQYLRTKDIIFINFLVIMWFAVLIARVVSIILRGGVIIDIYLFVGILPEFIIAPVFLYLRKKILDKS